MRGSKARAAWIAWMAPTVAAAVILWGANAFLVRSADDDLHALRIFLGNLQVFAVAVTSASVASAAWASYGLGRIQQCAPWRSGLLSRPLIVSLLTGLAGLVSGLGISWVVAAPATGAAGGLLSSNLRLACMVGTGFALVGAVVSDVSIGLARRMSRRPARNRALLYCLVILILNSLWAGGVVVAIGLAKAQVFRP